MCHTSPSSQLAHASHFLCTRSPDHILGYPLYTAVQRQVSIPKIVVSFLPFYAFYIVQYGGTYRTVPYSTRGIPLPLCYCTVRYRSATYCSTVLIIPYRTYSTYFHRSQCVMVFVCRVSVWWCCVRGRSVFSTRSSLIALSAVCCSHCSA